MSGVETVLSHYPNAHQDKLIPILQDVQDEEGYLSKEALVEIAEFLRIPTSKVYGVATFYNQFRFKPIGKYPVVICRGTACHVKGSAAVLDAFIDELGLEPGDTSEDGLFSLEVVACIGACGLAPVISVGGEIHGEVASRDVKKIVRQTKMREKENAD